MKNKLLTADLISLPASCDGKTNSIPVTGTVT